MYTCVCVCECFGLLGTICVVEEVQSTLARNYIARSKICGLRTFQDRTLLNDFSAYPCEKFSLHSVSPSLPGYMWDRRL